MPIKGQADPEKVAFYSLPGSQRLQTFCPRLLLYENAFRRVIKRDVAAALAAHSHCKFAVALAFLGVSDDELPK